jgi:hypothetical protein
LREESRESRELRELRGLRNSDNPTKMPSAELELAFVDLQALMRVSRIDGGQQLKHIRDY